MGTRTKNLDLYKPAPTDYVNVETDLNENFDKIDEKVLPRGTYQGKAQDLKDEIDEKVSKSGDTMTGSLQIDIANNHIELLNNGNPIGVIKAEENVLTITNLVSKRVIQLANSGSAYIQANNLKDESKEVINTINNTYDFINGNSGISNPQYIQDNGQKIVDNLYIDKITKKIYLCIKTNNSTSIIKDEFKLISNLELGKNITKIENLQYNNYGAEINFQKIGRIVYVGYKQITTQNRLEASLVSTLPENFRPLRQANGIGSNESLDCAVEVKINTDGTVYLNRTQGTYIYAEFSYVTKEV